MHQTKKGNQWHFGMKAHIGVDAESSLVHTPSARRPTPAISRRGTAVLHAEEEVIVDDAGYQGADKQEETTGVAWQVAMRPGKRKPRMHTPWCTLTEQAEKLKVSVRAKVEHPFRVIKRQFGFIKVRYRGLKKKYGATHHAICAVQYMDCQKQAFAEYPGISASANGQRAATELKNDWSRPRTGVIDANVSSREKYCVTSAYQPEFWTCSKTVKMSQINTRLSCFSPPHAPSFEILNSYLQKTKFHF